MPIFNVRLVCDAGLGPLGVEALDRAEETVTVEAPSLWEARSLATARMSISPRGRLLRAYDADTGVEVAQPSMADLHPGRFVIDGVDGVFAGFTRGESWNGWAVPYFTLAEALRVAEGYAAQPAGPDGQALAEHDAERSLIRLYDPSNGEWDEYGPVEMEGHQLYPVGAQGWTWEEV